MLRRVDPNDRSMIAMRTSRPLATLLARAACGATMMLAFMLSATGAAAQSRYSFDTTPGRLPKTVVPTHYAIELEPDLDKLTLAGSEVVDLEVREPTTWLKLNAVGMTLSAATIDSETQSADIALDAAN